MTLTSQANSKTAEFARLFDLFDRVATRRTRDLTEELISADDIVSVPAEFVPVLKNLSTILSSRAIRNEEHARRVQVASTTHPPCDTPDNPPSTTSMTENPAPLRVDATEPSDDVEEDADDPTFPLGERYPFTFKLMLHKLYDLDEWAEKVKSALESSKSQFKPLAERLQNDVKDATASTRQGGEKGSSDHPVLGASIKFKPPSTARRVHSTVMSWDATTITKERGEKKSSARPVLGASAKFKLPSTTRHSHTLSMPSKPDANRVLKKRCIGRRKSINGPVSAGVWVYNAAISATEVAGPRPAIEITLSTPRNAGGVVRNDRVRHQSLTALEDMQVRDTTRHKLEMTVPLLCEKVADPVQQPWSVPSVPEPAQAVTATESVLKKRTSMASLFTSGSCKRVAVKRPLCI